MRPRVLRSGFAVEVFDRARARSADLTSFLQLYLQYLAPEHRTKTNELIDFLENPLPGQVIVYFGLTYHGKPCGIATLMIYTGAQVGIVDHVAITPTVRGFGAFYSLCEGIRARNFPDPGVSTAQTETEYARNCAGTRRFRREALRAGVRRKWSGTVGWVRTTDLRIHNLKRSTHFGNELKHLDFPWRLCGLLATE